MRALLAAALLAQAATPRFPAEVELVTVDVVVVDRHGVPVTGLGRDEFMVREDPRGSSVLWLREIGKLHVGRGIRPREC
jgi:hypothetical protein